MKEQLAFILKNNKDISRIDYLLSYSAGSFSVTEKKDYSREDITLLLDTLLKCSNILSNKKRNEELIKLGVKSVYDENELNFDEIIKSLE